MIPHAFAVLAVLGAMTAGSAQASDLAKEARWAEQVVDQLFDGEAVWLTAGNTRFLGLYTEAAGEPKGSVVVMHGVGVHPDWPQVVNPLRVGLAERGWRTLSIQLPVLPNDAALEEYLPLYAEVPARLDAALAFLDAGPDKPVFLVGHSMGTSMALYYLRDGDHPAVAGLVMVGANSGGEGSLDPRAELVAVRVPVLDLYGEYDLVPVLTGVANRAAAAARAGNADYTQVEVPGADHFFEGYEAQLLEVVSTWLEQRRQTAEKRFLSLRSVEGLRRTTPH